MCVAFETLASVQVSLSGSSNVYIINIYEDDISTNERYNVRDGKIRVLMAPRATERLEPKVRVAPTAQSDIGKPLRAYNLRV